MILHHLRATHWRNLLNPTEVGPFADGLNVIHAPNGTGKSSLFEAMRRALFDAHLVTGKEIEAIRPWGRSLAPEVMVEFTQAGIRYRIEKTFLDSPSARLLRLEGGQFLPLATDRGADSKLREILSATDAPGRGLSKQEHWGLAQVLWAPQGSLNLSSLSPSVSENLRTALGVQLTGEGGTRLEELLEEQYLSFFTKGGKLRTGKDAAPILALETQHDEAVKERQRCLEEQRSYEDAARAVEDAGERRAQARREADAIREPLAQTRHQAEAYQMLQADLQRRRQAEQAAKDKFDSVGRTIELIAKARQELADLHSQIQRGETLLGEVALESKTARDLADDRRRKRDEARQKRASLNQLTAEVEDARAFISDTKSRQVLATKLEKLHLLRTALNTEKQSRSALVAPDDKAIRDVRKHLSARDKAQATLQASLIRLTLRPLRATTATRKSPAETRNIAAGEEATFTGSPEVSVEIQGFGSIHAAGPEMDVDALREEVTEADKKLAKLTQPYGTPDPDRLQLLRDQAKDLDQKIETLQTQIEGLLGEDTVDELQAQLAEVNARILERMGRFPAWKEHPPVVSDLQSTLEQQRNEIEAAVREAEDAFDQAQAAALAVGTRHTETEAGLRNARRNLEAANRRLSDLTNDGLSDDARLAARQEALMTWEAARSQARDCETRLAEIGEDPQKSVEKLERQLKAQEEAEAAARDDGNKAEGRLQTLAAEGVYSKLAACEEELEDLKVETQREKLRMEALRLLHDTVTSCKAAAVAAVAAPVERTATRMLARVAGPRLGTVRLTDQFVPTGIHPEALSEPVELDNLSGGEQEQLFLITRLALGEVLAKDERQLVVLDDVLNATDTGRLARLLTVLEEAADCLQIVILTCHPERYRALEAATFFNLQEGL
jgi:DNA repair exonuclease SbcCD ATPase subunit